jgi:hypothetical protein
VPSVSGMKVWVHHPNVRFPVAATVLRRVCVYRRQTLGKDVLAGLGKGIAVQVSHSLTVPVICSECGSGAATRAPTRSWTRIHGSNSWPSSRGHRT